MRFRAECSIDIDRDRRVWSVITGDDDAQPDSATLSAMAKAAADGAQQAFDHAAQELKIEGLNTAQSFSERRTPPIGTE